MEWANFIFWANLTPFSLKVVMVRTHYSGGPGFARWQLE
jgi:hypothetical protein